MILTHPPRCADKSTNAPFSDTLVPAPSNVINVIKRINPVLIPVPAAIAPRIFLISPCRPFTTCGTDITADKENEIILYNATTFVAAINFVGKGLISDIIVATNKTPITATIEPTEIFSQIPTNFMPA